MGSCLSHEEKSEVIHKVPIHLKTHIATPPITTPHIATQPITTPHIGLKIDEHTITSTSHYIAHYPNHPERKNTTLYNQTHHKLCIKQDLPCFICNKNKKNNQTITETHHYYIEECAMLAIDWIEFGRRAKFFYNPQTGVNIGSSFDWNKVDKNPSIFVDSEHNMIVLCIEHHRSSYAGIHHIHYPEWILQIAPKKDSLGNKFVFVTQT